MHHSKIELLAFCIIFACRCTGFYPKVTWPKWRLLSALTRKSYSVSSSTTIASLLAGKTPPISTLTRSTLISYLMSRIWPLNKNQTKYFLNGKETLYAPAPVHTFSSQDGKDYGALKSTEWKKFTLNSCCSDMPIQLGRILCYHWQWVLRWPWQGQAVWLKVVIHSYLVLGTAQWAGRLQPASPPHRLHA